eukprot:gene13577-biopygen20042
MLTSSQGDVALEVPSGSSLAPGGGGAAQPKAHTSNRWHSARIVAAAGMERNEKNGFRPEWTAGMEHCSYEDTQSTSSNTALKPPWKSASSRWNSSSCRSSASFSTTSFSAVSSDGRVTRAWTNTPGADPPPPPPPWSPPSPPPTPPGSSGTAVGATCGAWQGRRRAKCGNWSGYYR